MTSGLSTSYTLPFLFLFACEAGGSPRVDAAVPTDSSTVDSATESDATIPDAGTDPRVADLEALGQPRDIIAAVFLEIERHNPTIAIYIDDRSKDALLDDMSSEENDLLVVRNRKLDEKLRGIDVDLLTEDERIAYDIAANQVFDYLARAPMRTHVFELSSSYCLPAYLADLTSYTTLRNETDVDNLITRYSQVPRYFQQTEDSLTEGIAAGRVASRVIIERAVELVRPFTVSVAEDSPYSQNATYADDVSADNRADWQARIDAAATEYVIPAVTQYLTFLEGTLLPAGRETYGYGALPYGDTYYRSQIQYFSGANTSPEEIHALGVVRVAELETQMREQLAVLGIEAPSLADGIREYRALPEHSEPTVETATEYSDAFLGRLARTEWSGAYWSSGMPTPPTTYAYLAPGGTSYSSPDMVVYLAIEGRSLSSFDPDLVHEYTHFLQYLASADTKSDAPISPYTGFFSAGGLFEGTAHYGEALALETDLYTRATSRGTALVRLAALSNLMLRAVRLVVDTGIHAMDWSRAQTIEYMQARVAEPLASLEYEADRYASGPGQALSYRMGMEQILIERERARVALGDRFDLARFNQMVLRTSRASYTTLVQRTDRLIAE